MFTRDDLNACISKKWDELQDMEAVDVAVVTAAVVCDVYEECGQNDDAAAYCVHTHIRDVVGKFFNRHAREQVEHEANPQLDFFARLQPRYIVPRDGRDQSVKLDRLTDLEIDWLCATLQREAEAKQRHADDLQRYKRIRRVSA